MSRKLFRGEKGTRSKSVTAPATVDTVCAPNATESRALGKAARVRGISQETCLQGAKILSVGEKYAGKITVFKETLYTFLLLCIGRDSHFWGVPLFLSERRNQQNRIFAVFGKTQKRKEVLK